MRFLSVLFLLVLFLSACNQNKIDPNTAILGIWRMSESVNKTKNQKTDDPLLDEAKKLEEGKEGHVLSIFPDNSFTELVGKGTFTYGNWKWKEEGKSIEFKYSTNKIVTYDVEIDAKDTNYFTIHLSNSLKKISYLREAKLFENFKEEPFYFENNTWRIKPKKIENRAQLLNRLGNYFGHMLYILKAADTRKLDVISFEFSLGIVQIYNGGIGIVEYQYLPEEWKDTYFNQENLKEVYDLYFEYLQKDSYHGASTGNWVKDDYVILLSIYNDLKSGKFIE